jgi:inosose dehydratase
MSAFRVGYAPITWNNEDLKDLRPPVPYTSVLDQIRAAGYTGTELGDGFPRQARELKRALDERGLAMPSAWCGLALTEHAPDLEHTRRLCDLLAEVGASFVNLAHQGIPERRAWAGRANDPACPKLSEADWDLVAGRVSQAAEVARAAGLQAAFHLHVGTWVETQTELEALLCRTDPGLVKLCWDVGHALYAGLDPIEVVRRWPDRIAYVHLKDVDRAALDQVLHDQVDFEEGIRRRVFTELGRGRLDLLGLLEALRAVGYAGWLMVEQDSTWHEPGESAHISRTCLRTLGC